METNVNFYSDGEQIAGIVFGPDDGGIKRHPGVVLCQGTTGRKEFYRFPEIARHFVAAGCVVLTFDYRGFGESSGERGRLIPQEQVEDIRSGITFLEMQPNVNKDLLGLYGASFGGGTVPYVAAVDSRVKCAISVVGFGDGERLITNLRSTWELLSFRERLAEDRRSRVKSGVSEVVPLKDIIPPDPGAIENAKRIRSGIRGMENVDPEYSPLAISEKIMEFKPTEVVDRISPRAILFVTAEKDSITSADDVHDMYRRAGSPKELLCIPGINHADIYEEPYFDQALNVSLDWLRKHLHLNK